jgi:arylsulfatase A-like enzyme
MRNRYFNALYYVDGLIAELWQQLEQTGQLKDTVIVLTSDHGELFHEHDVTGHSTHLYEEVIHVPLLIFGAEEFRALGEGEVPVAHIDIAPTILKLLGLPPHENFQGIPIVVGKDELEKVALVPRTIYSSSQLWISEDVALRWPWKLRLDHRGVPPQLFYLESDESEIENLINAQPEIAKSLEQSIQIFRSQQFAYYHSLSSYKKCCFPPKY